MQLLIVQPGNIIEHNITLSENPKTGVGSIRRKICNVSMPPEHAFCKFEILICLFVCIAYLVRQFDHYCNGGL